MLNFDPNLYFTFLFSGRQKAAGDRQNEKKMLPQTMAGRDLDESIFADSW